VRAASVKTEAKFGMNILAEQRLEHSFVDGSLVVGSSLTQPSPRGRGLKKIPPELLSNARKLRQNSTDPEKILWGILRNRQILGMKFRRQHAFAGYVLDFYCTELNLAIELDGGQHGEDSVKEYDILRSQHLGAKGMKILRFWNNDVLYNIEGVFDVLFGEISSMT